MHTRDFLVTDKQLSSTSLFYSKENVGATHESQRTVMYMCKRFTISECAVAYRQG